MFGLRYPFQRTQTYLVRYLANLGRGVLIYIMMSHSKSIEVKFWQNSYSITKCRNFYLQ